MWSNIKTFKDEAEHVTKFVFEKSDIAIEAVLYRYPSYEERTVLCISTMCGCPIGCRFCGTGDYFVRSLSVDEIINQATYILDSQIDGINPKDIKKLQIMVMSMGEPVMVKALIPAFHKLHELYPQAALLISTSAPKVDYVWIRQLSIDIPTVGLQFSIHESTDEARNKLIPFKNKLTLDEISQEGYKWYQATGRRPYFNYCAHTENVSELDIENIVKLFPSTIWEATVSVVCERTPFEIATNEFQRNLAIEFGNKLLNRGYNVRVFDPAGQDTIGGGCGQLHYYQDWVAKHQDLVKQSIGYGLHKIHAPNA